MLYEIMEHLLETLRIEMPDNDNDRHYHLSKTKRIYATLNKAYELGVKDTEQDRQQHNEALRRQKKQPSLTIREVQAAIRSITSDLQYYCDAETIGLQTIAPEKHREYLLHVLEVLSAIVEDGSGHIKVEP